MLFKVYHSKTIKLFETKIQQQSPFYQDLLGLAIFSLIRSRHFFRSYASSLLMSYLFKSFFTHSFHDFLGRPFFLFPMISSSITSYIWELMFPRMTWPYHRRRFWIIISSIFTTPTLSWRTSVDTLSTSLIQHIILIMRRCTPRNLTSSATVSYHVPHQDNKTGLTEHW